ncbi:MAG: type II secretion system F family protein [Candidatus Marsarchaeota archaeon]|nr:type II secretion system F family protein [Candidatus Marsarchaeota archaeon]
MADPQNDTSDKNSAKAPVGFTKRKKFLFFKIRSRPIYGKAGVAGGTTAQPAAQSAAQPIAGAPNRAHGPAAAGPARAAPATKAKGLFSRATPPPPPSVKMHAPTATGAPGSGIAQANVRHPAQGAQGIPQTTGTGGSVAASRKRARSNYINRIVVNKKGLQEALRDVGVREEPYVFVKKMMINAIMIGIVLGAVSGYLFYKVHINMAAVLVLAAALAFAFYNMAFTQFLSFPMARARKLGREIERDILFATRDLVISMRSGMPLFNAMTAVSTGYGAASKEFAKVVSLIQLGMPIEQAMEDVSARSQSRTFKRLMLQASVSIKVGADIISSLQDVVQEIMEERTIELRRYGQRLNALAMFYMIFGVIFPSMGIAIATIMSTFISLFTIGPTDLAFVIVGVVGLQLIFLDIILFVRPGFSLE